MPISPTPPKTSDYTDHTEIQNGSIGARQGKRPDAKGDSGPGIGVVPAKGAATSDSSLALPHRLLEELRILLAEASKEGRSDGVNDRRGAPALYAPSDSIPVNDLAMWMMLKTNESQQAQMDFMAKSVDKRIAKLQKSTAVRITKQQEINAKVVEAAKTEKSAKVWGWIVKVAAVIGALAAVVVTGAGAVASGGAGTALFALSVMALVNASLSLADEVSKEIGGPEISIANLIDHTTVPMLETLGLKHDTAQSIAVGLAALPLVVIEPQLLGTTVEGMCKAAGVSGDTAKLCGQVVTATAAIVVGIAVVGVSFLATGAAAALPLVTRLANGLSYGAQLTRGGGAIAQGTLKIASAQTRKEASYIEADRKDLEADSTLMRKQMDLEQKGLQVLLQYIQNGIQSAVQVLSDLQKSKQQVSQNFIRSPV